MSEEAGSKESHPEDWAPHDYTDGRKPGDWKTRYSEQEARNWIWIEAGYLILLLLVSLAGVLYIVYRLCDTADSPPISSTGSPNCTPFLAYIGALASGLVGGCSFGVKWLYHSVAKQIWNEDRRLWRLLTPPLSGVVALFTVFLSTSGLLPIFDKEFMRRPIAILAFSFLVGYFSDKALAKMAELADTLLGRTDKGRNVDRPQQKKVNG